LKPNGFISNYQGISKCISKMSAAKPTRLEHAVKFGDAMRRAMRVPPLPSGKKARRKVWRKKQR
jgi:hypothetical protein